MIGIHLKSTVCFLVIITLSLLCGCSGGSSGSGSVNAEAVGGGVASVNMIDGNNQTAPVGTVLTTPLVAMIKNNAGQPIAGQIVNFVVTTGGGSVFAGAALTDVVGIARERWTLGNGAGVQTVEVRAVDSSGAAVVFAVFTATAAAAAPQTISIVSGNNQSAIQLQPLPLPVVAVVSDSYGNPVPGVTVAFAASNGGSVQAGIVTTDALGAATTGWTLGKTIGYQTLIATVNGLNSVTFSATATQAPATAAKTITKLSGDLQTVQQHLLLPLPIQVVVTDALNNPVTGAQVTFSFSSGSVYVNSVIVTTDINGKATWHGYFHTVGPQNINVSVAGLSTDFTTISTTSNHQYDGHYLCNGSISTLDLSNGLLPPGGLLGVVYGTFDEQMGTITGSVFQYTSRPSLSGQLTIESNQRVTGFGTITQFGFSYPTGNWTCERQ